MRSLFSLIFFVAVFVVLLALVDNVYAGGTYAPVVASSPVLSTHTEVRLQTVARTVARPVTRTRLESYTELVPVKRRRRVQYTELRQEVQNVQIPVQVQRTFATRQIPVQTVVARQETVMVPQVRTRLVPQTSYRTETVEVSPQPVRYSRAFRSPFFGRR